MCACQKTSFGPTISVSHSVFRGGRTQWVVLSGLLLRVTVAVSVTRRLTSVGCSKVYACIRKLREQTVVYVPQPRRSR